MSKNSQTVLSLFDIDPFRIGGTEAYARELSSQLADHGWTSVLCFNNAPPEAVRRYLSLPNIRFEVLHDPSARSLKVVRNLEKILTRYSPEILHLHYVPLVSSFPWLARVYSVHKVFYTDHWSRPISYVLRRSTLWKRIVGRVVTQPLTGVVAVSEYGKRCMVTSGLISSKRIRRIYNAVDLTNGGSLGERAFLFRQRFSIPGGRALVVQVSWLIPEKGIRDLLLAARQVLAENSAVHFVLVGEGQYRGQFENLARELGIADHVTWTGSVLNPIAEGVYAAADVVCQVSRWEEVFGWTISEAMACSRPVIATRVGGIPELVRDGVTGFLVPPGDADAIAARIVTLLEDDDLRRKMGGTARQTVEEKFNLKTNVTDLLNYYRLNHSLSNCSKNNGLGDN